MAEYAYSLRWAVVDDIDRIIRYHTACWDQSFRSIVSPRVMQYIDARSIEALQENWVTRLEPDSTSRVMVAVDSSDVAVGHAIVDGHELVHLCIDPAHHRHGLGQQLLEVAERLIQQAGHDQAELHTIVGNTPAIRLYTRNGWVLTEAAVDNELPNGSQFTEHVMTKSFDTART